jgi:glutamine synthetase
MLAAGMHSMDRNLALEEALVGDDYAATFKASFPKSLQEARKLFADSEIALEAFGEEVVGHYPNMARVEVCSCGISKPSTGRPSWTLRRYSPVGVERRGRPRTPILGRA